MRTMRIRRAGEKDLEGVRSLLAQVLEVHAQGRPDLFRPGTRKYTDEELLDDARPVFVAVEDAPGAGCVLGHAFCEVVDMRESNNMQPIVSLYVDDICVDERARGKHVGTELYDHVLDYARAHGYHNVTLNAWAANPAAVKFYESLGMSVYRYGMEQIL